MSLISLLLRASRRTVALAIVFGVLSGATSAVLIAAIHRQLKATSGSARTAALGFAVVCLVLLVSKIATQLLLNRLAQRTSLQLRLHLSRQILAAPLRVLEAAGAARILAVLIDDVMVITSALSGLPGIAINLAIVASCMVYLGWLAPKVLTLFVVFALFGAASYSLLARPAFHALGRAREGRDALFEHLRALVEGIKELKLNRTLRRRFIEKDLEATSRALLRDDSAAHSNIAIASTWGNLLFFVLIGVLLFVAPLISPVPLEVQSGFTLAVLFMMSPIEGVLGWIPNVARASAALRKVEGLGLELDRAREPVDERPAAREVRRIELKGATYRYRREGRDDTFLLGPIDLTIESGQLVFVVGGNGSGKSTLGKLIAGLYLPEQGTLSIDGVLVDEKNRDWYCQHFSAVFADYYLFERLGGDGWANLDEAARRFLERLHLAESVRVKDGVLSTTKLSQGQRKRLMLLAALLEDRPMNLFDEWAADQDPEFKKVFYTQFLPELKARGKAAVVITHDDRYFRQADRIIRLENGKIEEEIRPQEGYETEPSWPRMPGRP